MIKLNRRQGFLAAVLAIGVAALSACASNEAPAATATRAATATPRPAAQPTPTPGLGGIGATPGPLAPFTLPKAGGGEIALADYIGMQPVSIVFYRGFF